MHLVCGLSESPLYTTFVISEHISYPPIFCLAVIRPLTLCHAGRYVINYAELSTLCGMFEHAASNQGARSSHLSQVPLVRVLVVPKRQVWTSRLIVYLRALGQTGNDACFRLPGTSISCDLLSCMLPVPSCVTFLVQCHGFIWAEGGLLPPLI